MTLRDFDVWLDGNTGTSDTPPGLKPHGCSVHPRRYPGESPQALPAPLNMLRGVMVPVQACPAGRATLPAHGEAFRYEHAAARARLARTGA